ncbi:hypothetical protein [Niallia circulans]|uniref:hypothetical protein n=1 Tax=Niallia circulans TaxID=1397 RepID=UPI001F2C12E3|nr:hypothetical protein [Niallia circulans]MCF2650257.1 hypothetical protein [Niallia circulans]
MIIVGTFKPSIEIEHAISEIEQYGIPPEEMMVFYMNAYPPISNRKKIPIDIHVSSFEIGMAFATGFAVIGASIGFKLIIGPIFSGLLAAIIGFTFGYSIYYFFHRKKESPLSKSLPDIIIIIQSPKEIAPSIKQILWKHEAKSVGMRKRYD